MTLREYVAAATAKLTDALDGSHFLSDEAVEMVGEALDYCQAALALIDDRPLPEPDPYSIPVALRLCEMPDDFDLSRLADLSA